MKRRYPMSPECRLLRIFLSSLAAAPPDGRRPPAREEIDWPSFAALVAHHGLSSLLFRKLDELPWTECIPAALRAALEDAYHAQLRSSVVGRDRLRLALGALGEEGIECVVLKGGHLAEEYYADHALRPMEDVDLLVRPARRQRVRDVLGRRGFALLGETATAERFVLADGAGRPELVLEVHTNLQTPERRNPSFAVDIEDFWRSSRPSRVAGASVLALAPTLNLLYLSAHFSHHAFSRLIWAYDLHLLQRDSGDEIDWDALVGKARLYRCASQVYYGLLFAREFFGSPLAGPALRALAPSALKRLAASPFLNWRRVLGGGVPVAGPSGLLQRLFLNDSWALAVRSYFMS